MNEISKLEKRAGEIRAERDGILDSSTDNASTDLALERLCREETRVNLQMATLHEARNISLLQSKISRQEEKKGLVLEVHSSALSSSSPLPSSPSLPGAAQPSRSEESSIDEIARLMMQRKRDYLAALQKSVGSSDRSIDYRVLEMKLGEQDAAAARAVSHSTAPLLEMTGEQMAHLGISGPFGSRCFPPSGLTLAVGHEPSAAARCAPFCGGIIEAEPTIAPRLETPGPLLPGGTQTPTVVKKQQKERHVESERRRRVAIRQVLLSLSTLHCQRAQGFDELCALVPGLEHRPDYSKSVVLSHKIADIRRLQQEKTCLLDQLKGREQPVQHIPIPR
ncbi:MAG: hypothetical protein SGCHY_004568 [Lobulomycetales sp.]